jgi:hypothetical protein
VDGDDLRAASLAITYQKTLWPVLSNALVQAQTGDGTLLRIVADVFYEHGVPSVFDPFVAITAVDERWPRKAGPYLRDGRTAHRRFKHFWWNAGYSSLAVGLWPVKSQNAHFGPVSNSRSATTTLVVGTTHDPATPYRSAQRLTADLGNARLLTMRGDGHTASFADNSPCIDATVRAYLESLTLPARGATCTQTPSFTPQGLRAAPRVSIERMVRDALARR